MPNYRNKKKNNNNNRNKNKNLNKSTSSSSVKQEIRIVESKTTTTTTTSSLSGNEPNLPANVVVKNSYTSAKNSTVFENEEKIVNVDEAATTTKPSILSSSALSNEEIDENASNVDIDTFSGSEDTAHKQSNYSSKFLSSSSQSSSSCSHFKKSTEIEDHQRQLNRAVFNIEDSTLADSVIRETFVKDSNSVKNSLKTGSANTKDASAVSADDDLPPATTETSIENTRINESFSENVRNVSEERSKSTESATEVIESNNQSRRRQFSSSSNEDSSKVIVQKVVVKNATTIPSSSEKVIVHQISKEDQSINEPKVIVHHEESSSSSTSHRASKNNGVDLSKKTSTKACESSTTQTLSFSNVRGQPSSRQIIYEPRKVIFDSFPIHQGGAPSRGIIHQISKEDDKSKVIVHQISREDQQKTASSSNETVITQHTAPQTTDYRLVVHQISPSSPRSPEIDQFGKVIDHSIFKESFAGHTSRRVDHSKISKPSSPRSPDHSGKVIDHSIFKESFAENISKRVNIDQQDRFTQNISKKDAGSQVDQQSSEQPKKVVLIPIVQENSTQTSPLPSFTDNPLHSGLFKLIKDENSESSKKSEISQQTSSSPLSRSPVICFENLSKSFELNKENSEEKPKILQEESSQTSPTVLQPNRKSPQRNTDHLEPLRIPAFPINRVNKVIIHPIINEASGKPVFPYSEKSMETIDNSSKKIAKEILKEVSSELKSSYLAELTKHKIEEIHCEPVRTSFPVSVKNQASFRPGFFETNIHQKEINPLEAEVKVIVHKISKEDQKSEKSEDLHSKESNNLKEKVINHQISNEDQKSTETKPKSDDLHPKKANNIEKKVIVHQISQEESSFLKNLHIEETKSKISNQQRQPIESQTNVSSPEFKITDHQSSQEESKKTKDHQNEDQPKVIVHQISRSPSFPLINETNEESIPKVSVPSKDSFPLSSLKIDHPEQYNSRSTILEQKTINFKKLREESKLTQSSASPFAMSKMEDKKIQPNPKAKIINHPILQAPPTTSFPVLGEKQKQSSFTSQPIFTSKKPPTSSSFPISVEKETHQTQYTSRPKDSQQKTIDLQSLRDSAEFRQSSSTMTSTFGLTEMEKKNEIIHQVLKEEPFSDLQKQLSSPKPSGFPAEKKKEIIHPIQKEEPSNDLQKLTNNETTFSGSSVVTSKTEDQTVNRQTLKESSIFSQTSSTKTSSSTETKKSEDQPKEIIHPFSKEKSSNDLQNLQKDVNKQANQEKPVPKEVTHKILKEDSDSDLPLPPPPPPEILDQLTEDHQKSSSTSQEKPKEIVHQIVKEDSFSDLPLPPPPETLDHQISQDESISSSEGSVLTAILNESPRSISPPIPAQPAEEPKPKESSKEKSPKRSFFLAPLELTNKAQPATEMKQDLQMISPDFVKVINHPIIRQIEKPLGYRVESPQPEKLPMIVKKSKSFDDDDVVIQEMSDTSSAGDTDNPPVISEAESETDTLEACDDFSESPSCSSLVSVQTLPMDQESESKSSQDYKSRRQQNRAALETHFLPQFLAPNFLDSIKEENSDMSDSDRRSSCSDRIDPPPHHADLDDDVFLDPPKKANAVYPKSNLDFSKKHKHVLNVRSPKTSVIREEASPPSVVEAKIIDQGSIEESCSSWSTDLTPESEAAEVVYIDSASSSVSDLLELDYSQGQTDDVRIQTPTIDLESVNEMFATCQSNDRKILNPPSEKPPPPPPVNDGDELRNNKNEQNLLGANNKNNLPNTIKSNEKKIETKVVRKNQLDEIIFEKIETMSETQDTQKYSDDLSGAEKNSIENNLNSCDSAIDQIVTSNTSAPSVSATAAGSIKNMESLREIVNASTSSTSNKSELDQITDLDDFSKPNFMIGQPCSDHTLKCDTSSSSCTSSSTTTTNNTLTTTTTTKILTLHDLSQSLDNTKNPLVSPNSTTSALDRQESLDSHNSDQSHSTNQSQCTAINQGSLPPQCDWNEFDASTDTTYVSESDTAAGLASSEASSPLTLKGAGHSSADETDSQTIRKLRSLCTEALASMPYGEEVLQELATVSKNIQEMPYPLPDLPQIQDIQLSLGSKPEKSSVITLSQVPPSKSVPPLGQKFKSPPPPPVPEPPSKYDSWLGVPTESDPNVLVCLSPSQRNAVKSDSTADSLLDMHKKFVERRGYHEYTTKQVNAINQANNTSEAVKLSKIDSPPPPPLPPRPQTELLVKNPNGNTDINVDNNDDDEDAENNHRLLAIIRDTHEKQQQKQTSMTSTSENISRRTADTNESGIHHTTTTPKDGEKTSSSGLDKEFSKTPSSVNKLTQERTFIGESNKSRSEMHYQSESEHSTSKKFDNDSETVMGMKFPTSDYFDSIFADKNKRFSNIESGTVPEFCSQILTTQPKRYSNIETSSFESKKCVENGKVLYDVSDSKREKISEGDQPSVVFPEFSTKPNTNDGGGFPFSATPNRYATGNGGDSRPQTGGDSENIMSAFKLNTTQQQNQQTTAAPPPSTTNRTESSPPAPPVPPLPPTFTATNSSSSSITTTKKSTSTSESSHINRSSFNAKTSGEKTFDNFGQHAKEAASTSNNESSSTKKPSENFQHEKLFKEFDELSNLLNNELESGKRRPPATLNGNDIPTNVIDYNRVARESKIQNSHVSSTTTSETNHRREQMKKLAEEIDRTSKHKLQQRREMRIPITIEKSAETGPKYAPILSQQPRSYEIPVQIENGRRPSLQQERSFERQRTYSEHQSGITTHEIPIQVEKPTPERFRRAESMFNISDSTTSRQHLHHDDWMKYVGDLGSSENICKPFQREVEICYLGRRPNIRAPRMSASTNDLSNIQTFDTHGAYDVRRTAQTPRPQQAPRRQYLSTQSLIDTTPITPCVSTGRRSPAPERRSSLPREIHDKQLQYITSKEQQLKYEFERLENERRHLIDEMNRVQMNQRISREAYRQRQLPPLTEDESFRQQMAEEWLNKVAEREERRLQKIIKISKVNQEAGVPVAPPRRHSAADDIGDEFLRRVKERRSKLCMPSDSDWESGAESHPMPRTDGSRSETDEPPVTVFEGHSAANIKQLPKHLREFAKLTSQMKEEHREEMTENTSTSASKMTSLKTSVKTSSSNNQQQRHSMHESSQSMLQDATHVRDLEQQLSHHTTSSGSGKRPKLVTILRHKKPAENNSGGSGVGGASNCQQLVGATATTSAGNSNTNSSAIKRRKQTRFLLTPNRRSWSESDLLREIDKDLVLAKGFLYANESFEMFAPKFKATAPPGSGVWTPKNQTPTSSRTNLNDCQPHHNNNNNNNHNNSSSSTNSSPVKERRSENRSSSACGRTSSSQKGIPTPPPPPLWTPQPERKQFRPVHFESPTLQRKYVQQQSSSSEVPSPPWSYTNSQPFSGYQSSQSCTNLSQKDTPFSWPPTQSSTASQLSQQQKKHQTRDIVNEVVCEEKKQDIVVVHDDNEDDQEGFPPTTSIADKIRSFERSHSNNDLYRPLVRHNPHEKPAIIKPNEVIFSVKNEYMSEPETEYEKPKKMAQLSRRQYDGIGPTTKHGMPVVLRSEVKEPNQHEWYKRIFQTIHKQKNPDDYVTIRYKCPRGRYPYKANGYMSEPEPNYDSDYSTVKYRTLERRRLQSTGTGTESRTSAGPPTTGNESHDETFYGTMPNPVKSGQGSYKVQPGRIENYITGHSSVSEKEKKEWWDEVMDIFNGQLDQQKLSPHYTEGNLSRALLKEQGYTSDSNLVFRKKDVPILQSPLSPVEQKQVYKSVQAGGQPPLLGFRKPAPEKPKDDDDVPPTPPVPPTKGVPLSLDSSGSYNLESPNRYFESDVNIHYKTPIRYEYKDPIPEEELAIRQAETMQKLYQEERRRKYLQELQDMNSRRHTDNFTPSQKSPIPLNRYDDFNSDLAPKSPNTSSNYPRTVARALYNFQGQTARELTFKKGDVIYIRRQIDKNWYEGEHNAMIGLLPSNYVELLTKDGIRQPPKKPSEGQARAKYNFQAQSGIELSLNKGEHVTLTRRVDENWYEGKIANRKGIFPVSYVEVLVDIGAEDKAGGRLPAATQSIITQSSSSMRPSLDTLRTNINNEFNSLTSNGQQPPNGILRETRTLHKTEVLHVDTNTEPVAYRALYKYRPQNTDELELQEGDVVFVLEKCDDGWFVGTSQRSGCFGTFPGNYVERV